MRAADHLRTHFEAPALLIGHSLGGAAVLAAAHRVPEATAVVTIAAPSDVAHVLQHFHADLATIERDGVASVTLAGRTFTIRKEFIEDVKAQALKERIANLRKALLVMPNGSGSHGEPRSCHSLPLQVGAGGRSAWASMPSSWSACLAALRST